MESPRRSLETGARSENGQVSVETGEKADAGEEYGLLKRTLDGRHTGRRTSLLRAWLRRSEGGGWVRAGLVRLAWSVGGCRSVELQGRHFRGSQDEDPPRCRHGLVVSFATMCSSPFRSRISALVQWESL